MQDRQPGPLTVSAEIGGLGNRIKSWVSVMRSGNDWRVHWPVNKYMPASFSQLFLNKCDIAEIPPQAQVYKSWRLDILPEDLEHLPAGFATVGAGAHPIVRATGKAWWSLTGRKSDRYQYMLFPKYHSKRITRADARHIDLEYGRIPDYFRRSFVPLFREISVKPDIALAAEDWATANIDKQVVGVQVRTWRDEPRRYRKYHLPAMKRLHRLMRETPDDMRFLVVSDSDDIVPQLAADFGEERILCYPRKTSRNGSWQSVEGVSEDLIDMLLLSRCERLFASYLSTFSETAWWLGGAKADVSVF
ncbi:MAG: hypothetical protein OEW68_10865 [Gammaproteobacteria bacterium]|nr:hypothetical protein [Gammaproteobacteria bacterium]MDH4315331.1 hypothetical protein [Gammaproteobacteria bacterium]MDH5215142.1 hypothetical protein [Gammaproteobacteria bacterium]MDH5501039.1 hypothetical protein [Gammaproteobacteria bacterium]